MTYPTVHLNGTDGRDLLRQLCEAMIAIREAVSKVVAAGPNARDYYVQGPGAFGQAQDEYNSRIDRLEAVCHELDDIAANVAKQNHEREARKA